MTISIEQGQWRKIRPEECPDEDILIDRLGACLGIFVYDTDSRVTFAGHFPSPDAQHADGLFRLLDQSVADFKASPLVRIYVSGCAEQDHESWETTGAVTHRFVEAELRKRHRPNQRKDVRWPRQKVLHTEMSLYPGDGTFGCQFHW